MKTNKQIIGRLMMGCVLACCLTSNAHAQNASSYAVVENGANYRVLQKTTVGNGTNRIHQYVELATGLYYKTNGQWVESQDLIETYPQGAIARHGPYQVIFANNLNSAGAIDQQTPDGKRLRSSILGLAYDDRSTGKNVLIAQIQDSQGELISSNQVLYPNAFDGVVKADVRYTYRKGSFEQDVILRQQPPTPESLGLNSQSTEIEVLTEFINPPQASIVEDPVANNALPDEEIGWGIMRIGHGKAFDLGEPRNSRSRVSVRRQWVTAQGRNILVEGVPLQRIKKSLANLPLQASAATKLPMLASKTLTLPKTPLGRLEPKPMRLALASPPDKGFVLDYTELNTSQSDFTFQPNTTYFISGSFGISGTTTFGAGTVIKFPEDGSGQFYCANVVCATTPYSPAIFTSENDDSAGEVLPWSNGSPTAFNCGNGLEFSGSVEVDHCRFSYFGTALTTLGSTVFNDAQFSQCYWGIVPCNNVMLNNALVNGCNIFCDGGMVCSNASFYNCSAAADGNSLFYNCTFSAMGNTVYDLYEYGAAPDGSNNAFDNSDQAFGANVVTGSIVDAGNTTADKVGLYWWTTQGPIEGTTIVDLGYHTPAVDGSGNPISTLVPGVPDYISDPRGVGLPDAWQEAIFGNLNQYASDLDPSGNTLFYDYQNGIDPNTIQFWIEARSSYADTSELSVPVKVTAGVPCYQAVLVDSTNFASATWTAYTTSNITVNLGATEGWHRVWIGLESQSPDLAKTWESQEFKLDTTPPVVAVVNPAAITTSGVVVQKPYLQLQGYGNEQLGPVTYDITNMAGVFTNQQGFVTGQMFDTNIFDFTTNDFQCYDVPLTNGLNLITLHVSDLAGNMVTTNIAVTLDYAGTTNPAVTLLWPQDGMAVSGTNITLRGTVSDETGTIVAQIVNGDGTTNTVQGLVERNGMFWLENVPLNGTNQITIQATAASGANVTTTNLTILPGGVGLTIGSTPTGTDLYQSSGSVSGTVGDSSATVTVNGVAATVSGNNWSAANVPIYGRGTATFDAVADAPGSPPVSASVAVEMPSYVELVEYHETKDYTEPAFEATLSRDYTVSYGGNARTYTGAQHVHGSNPFSGYTTDESDSWSDADPEGTAYFTDNDGYSSTEVIGSLMAVPDYDLLDYYGDDPIYGYSVMYVTHNFAKGVPKGVHWTFGSGDGEITEDLGANTRWVLHTGGKALSGRQNLFCINLEGDAKYGQPVDPPWGLTPAEGMDPTAVGVMGGHFGSDGNYWTVLADNADVDLGITVPADHASVVPGSTKYTMDIMANGNNLSTGYVPTFCVGESVGFSPYWEWNNSPPVVDTVAHWDLPGKFVNEATNYSPTCTTYVRNDELLNNVTTGCWFINGSGGSCRVSMNLFFANGQVVFIQANGALNIYRPHISDFKKNANGATPQSDGLHAAMQWTADISTKYSGLLGVTQIITCGDSISDYFTQGLSLQDGNSEIYGEPGNFGVPKQINANDLMTDYTTLGDNPFDPFTIYHPCVTMIANFTDYIRFAPNGGIFVTLATVQWHMNGSLCEGSNTVSPDDFPPASDPVDSDAFPLWVNYWPE